MGKDLNVNTSTWLSVTVDGVWIGNWILFEHLQNVTTSNKETLTELHTIKFTVNAEHMKSSQSSLAVAW
jgi:hypothetical protein